MARCGAHDGGGAQRQHVAVCRASCVFRPEPTLARGHARHMELKEALDVLQLPASALPTLTAAAVRKQYLRLALRTHPDKNSGDHHATERFSALGAAHTAVLAALAAKAAAHDEQRQTATLLELLLRALAGEDVQSELQAAGEYRPPAAFGVDLAVPFDARVLSKPAPQPGAAADDGQPDMQQAFHNMFREEGLTDDGDPLGGYELPPVREV